jgi:proline iminopeptidase
MQTLPKPGDQYPFDYGSILIEMRTHQSHQNTTDQHTNATPSKSIMQQRHPHDVHPTQEGQLGSYQSLMRHISMSDPTNGDDPTSDVHPFYRSLWDQCRSKLRQRDAQIWAVLIVCVVVLILVSQFSNEAAPVPIERAEEHMLDIGGGLSLWFRTWGSRENGVPVLFVHGGPGNCIADYGFGNARFFDKNEFFVVEVDQRGTGKSQPSVRDKCENQKFYRNITIDQMSHDYELVRKNLNIDKWLVFGGSWGSTLSIDYVQRYPEPILGLILRGVWLNTRREFDSIFTRSAYHGNDDQLAKFDLWWAMAEQEAIDSGEKELDPDDAERFFRLYGRLIHRCDMMAIWRWHTWENNQMEEDPANLLDPYNIDPRVLPEAMSIAFFENRLFLDGTFDDPSDLLGAVHRMKQIHIWICQGLRDKVCPTKYGALRLADALVDAGVTVRSQFLDAGHEDTNPLIAECLMESVDDFMDKLQNANHK